jgi:signal transduction histidine kinase
MKLMRKFRSQIVFTSIGFVVGYLMFHPYTMLVSFLMNNHFDKTGGPYMDRGDVFTLIRATFEPVMFPMAVSFALFGGITGLLIGVLIDRRKRLFTAELENEKKKAELETLRRLMVTLSHYLLNANTVIGGMARRSRRNEANVQASLDVIEEEAKKIDAVIRSLKEITEIRTADYTTSGKDLMIDITKNIEEHLKNSKGK